MRTCSPRNEKFRGLGLAVATFLVASTTGAQPRIDTPRIIGAVVQPVDVAFTDPVRHESITWIKLPSRDLGLVAAVLPPKFDVPFTADAVRRKIADPLLRSLKFRDRAMSLRVGDEYRAGSPPLPLAERARRISGRTPDTRDGPALTFNEALLGAKSPSASLERAVRLATGDTVSNLRREFGEPRTTIPILQTYNGVPIEHVALLVSGRKSQGARIVQGTVLRQWRITNRRALAEKEVRPAAYDALARQLGIERDKPSAPEAAPQLVLLPYGNADAGSVALRYTWRLTLYGRFAGESTPFVAWLDAESAKLLKVVPLVARADAAVARVWRRDPGVGGTGTIDFQIDAANDGKYHLKLHGFSDRLDLDVDEETGCHPPRGTQRDDQCDVAIEAGGAPMANFDQPTINNAATAVCRHGDNVMFQQASLFALLYVYRERASAYDVFPPFPHGQWRPQLETDGCSAGSTFKFGACKGYYHASCPDYSTGTTDDDNRMNLAHDSTIVAHEFGHNAVNNLTVGRPPQWCLPMPFSCSEPIGLGHLHGLADAWAADFENTNCLAGWAAKNVGGVNASNNCSGTTGHFADNRLPRLHEVSFPFNLAVAGDHFPEHREVSPNEHGDMQIAAAALWQVREAMRGQFGLAGLLLYVDGISGTLHTGLFTGSQPGNDDRGIYTHLYFLEVAMLFQWTLAPSSLQRTSNKVMGGFAKIGVFAIPPTCLEPGGAVLAGCKGGGDAVVEVDDNDPGDDIGADGLAPERDFIRRDGATPVFHVWTGARFAFDAMGSARPLPAKAPCHSKFKLEVSPAEDFSVDVGLTTDWLPAPTDNTSATIVACYVAWSPPDDKWRSVAQDVSEDSPLTLYYRVTTRDESDGNERVSTKPAGLWNVPPPLAVVNVSGKPGL